MFNTDFLGFDIIIAVTLFFFVNVLGEKGLSRSYSSNMLGAMNSSTRMFNIGYRILAPVVGLLVVVLAIAYAAPGVKLHGTFWAIVFYWILRFLAWILQRHQLRSNFALLVTQAVISIALCWFLYSLAIDDPIRSLVPQASDISLEFAVLVLLVIFQTLAQSPLFRKQAYPFEIQEQSEAFLYRFENDYRHLYSSRMNKDVVLRMLFLSFALAENHYRPASFRALERVAVRLGLQRFGIARTTGVMQIKADRALSDEESVKLAIPIVEEIYDGYLSKANRLGVGGSTNTRFQRDIDTPFFISFAGYSYDLDAMCNAVRADVHSLYGKYSGSNLVNPRFFFKCACDFVIAEDYESGSRTVFVPYALLGKAYGRLPLDDWRRIEKESGFACKGSGVQCAVFDGESIEMRTVVERMSEHEQYAGSIALLYCSSGRLVTLVLKSHECFESIAESLENAGLKHKGEYTYRADYFFNSFQSAITSLKNEIEQVGPPADSE